MINEIPKTGGLVPRPQLQAPQQARETGAVARPTGTSPGPPPSVKPSGATGGVQKAQAENLAQDLQKLVQNMHRELSFKVDDETEQMVIQVIDAESGEVVRQIPPERILELQQRLSELRASGESAEASVMNGMLFNDNG
jgi:flagellar protein FlaG